MNNTFDIFDEMTNEIDMKLLKLQLFNEAAKREFELNKQQAEIKVLKESGTQSDLNMLYEAAEEGLINKMQRSLKAAIEALKEFIKKIIDKIKSIFQSKQGKETLDKMEDICNKNPNVKNRKIEITDIDKEQKCLQKGIDKLSGIIAKIKGGHNKDSFDKEIDDVIEETNRERAKIIAIGAGITVTVGAAIALIKKYTKTSEDIGKNAIYAVDKNSELNEINDVMSNISGTDIDDDEALQAAKLGNDKVIKAKNAQINLCKERMSSVLNFIKTTGNKLRGKVISRDLEKEMNESTEYIDVSIDSSLDDVNDVAVESYLESLYNEVIVESGTGDIKDELRKMTTDYRELQKKIKSSIKEKKLDDAIKYIDEADKILDKSEKVVTSVVTSTDISVKQEVTDNMVYFLKVLATDFVSDAVLKLLVDKINANGMNIPYQSDSVEKKVAFSAIATAIYKIRKEKSNSSTGIEMSFKNAVKAKRKQLSKYKNNIEKIKSKLSTYNESVGFDDMIAIETTSLGLNDDSFDILESEIFDI